MLKQLVSAVHKSIFSKQATEGSRQEKWHRSWSNPNFAPRWQAQGIPQAPVPI